MSNVPVQDSRRFFLLPQGYEGGGYYVYGSPSGGRSQYAHPSMISLICAVASRWSGMDNRPFGVGNISLAGGPRHPDHATHRTGLEVDIRPMRVDGKHLPCTIRDREYDREATAQLIRIFVNMSGVRKVLFNDATITGVWRAAGHDNHFYVSLNPKG